MMRIEFFLIHSHFQIIHHSQGQLGFVLGVRGAKKFTAGGYLFVAYTNHNCFKVVFSPITEIAIFRLNLPRGQFI